MGLPAASMPLYTRQQMNPMASELKQALAALDAGKIQDARQLCQKLGRIPARAEEALLLRGLIANKTGRHAEAVQLLDRAAKTQPPSVRLHSALGVSCAAIGQRSRAAESFVQCIQLDPHSPHAYLKLADVCLDLRQFDTAIRLYHQVIALVPGNVEGWNNLAIALRKLGRLPEAAEAYQRALALRPDDSVIHLNLSHTLLAAGRLSEGFHEFKHRCQEAPGFRPRPQPVWNGEPMPGRTLLVFAEQGLGDTIQFVRYLPWVRERAGRVILECQRPLQTLLEHSGLADQVVAAGEPPPPHEACVPLMHLPAIFGTTLATIPAAIPYLAAPSPASLPDGMGDKLKVGVAWAGNRAFRNDAFRSMRLKQLLPLLAAPGVRFFSLQKELAHQDQADFPSSNLVPLIDSVRDFADTAALLGQLDLIISVDTAVAHLASALGKPVWVLLPDPPDWRWLTQRDDSPWYPTMRLFRQIDREGWGPLIARVAGALAQFKDRCAPLKNAGQ